MFSVADLDKPNSVRKLLKGGLTIEQVKILAECGATFTTIWRLLMSGISFIDTVEYARSGMSFKQITKLINRGLTPDHVKSLASKNLFIGNILLLLDFGITPDEIIKSYGSLKFETIKALLKRNVDVSYVEKILALSLDIDDVNIVLLHGFTIQQIDFAKEKGLTMSQYLKMLPYLEGLNNDIRYFDDKLKKRVHPNGLPLWLMLYAKYPTRIDCVFELLKINNVPLALIELAMQNFEYDISGLKLLINTGLTIDDLRYMRIKMPFKYYISMAKLGYSSQQLLIISKYDWGYFELDNILKAHPTFDEINQAKQNNIPFQECRDIMRSQLSLGQYKTLLDMGYTYDWVRQNLCMGKLNMLVELVST